MGQTWSSTVRADCLENEQTWDVVNKSYQEMLAIDMRYAQLIATGLKAFGDYRLNDVKVKDDVRKALLDSICLSGSCTDGGGTCRWFKDCCVDVELDLMCEVGQISPQDEEAILEMLPEKPGFAMIRSCPEILLNLNPLLMREKPDLVAQFNNPKEKYWDTALLQETVMEFMKCTDSRKFPKRAALFMQVDKSEVGIDVTQKIEGPSIMTKAIICHRNDPWVTFSADCVMALKIVKWPKLLDQWLQREDRCWQDEYQHVVDACFTQGCHLVPKKSAVEMDVNTEWRLSFSYMEQILMTSWNEHQKLCYYFLKSLFYRYLRGIEHGKKHIPSYALKTAMLWVSERTQPSEWTEANLKRNCLRVLKKLEDDLRKGFIPNYFIPAMNVIDPSTYPHSLTEQVAQKISSICENLEGSIPVNLEEMTRLGNTILIGTEAVTSYGQHLALESGNKGDNVELLLAAINVAVELSTLPKWF